MNGRDPTALLSQEQIATFKERGFLQLDVAALIGEAQLASWCEQLWEHFGVSEHDPRSWARRLQLAGATVSPKLFELPLLQGLVNQLSDGAFVVISPDDRPVCVFPGEQRQLDPHLDGYSQRGWAGGFMLGAVLYLNDVMQENAGCFTVLEGSHRASHRYFLRQPHLLDGSYMFSPDFQARGHRSGNSFNVYLFC